MEFYCTCRFKIFECIETINCKIFVFQNVFLSLSGALNTGLSLSQSHTHTQMHTHNQIHILTHTHTRTNAYYGCSNVLAMQQSNITTTTTLCVQKTLKIISQKLPLLLVNTDPFISNNNTSSNNSSNIKNGLPS